MGLHSPPSGGCTDTSSCIVESCIRRKSVGRLSREFLSYCLCDDDDLFTAVQRDLQDVNSQPFLPEPVNDFFCLDGSDSENEVGNHDCVRESTLEEMFSFNLEQITIAMALSWRISSVLTMIELRRP